MRFLLCRVRIVIRIIRTVLPEPTLGVSLGNTLKLEMMRTTQYRTQCRTDFSVPYRDNNPVPFKLKGRGTA